MPTNIEAEQTVLGCVLLEGYLIKDIELRPEHFYRPAHQLIFEAMKKLEAKEEPIDLATITFCFDPNKLTEIGGVNYLENLATSVPTTSNLKVYEKYVLDAWKLRQAQVVAHQLLNVVNVADTEVVSEAIQQLTRIEEVGYEDDFDLNELQSEMWDEFETMEAGITGITTGYTDLDLMTNGLQDQDLIIVGARPSIGKTAFMLNLAMNAAVKQKAIPVIFSLEMPKKLLMTRIYSFTGNIDSMRLRNPKLAFQDADWTKLTQAMGIVGRTDLKIYDKPNQTVQEMRSRLRRLKAKYPGRKFIAFIDYLQLIKGSGKENRNLEIAEISRNLKLMARDLEIPVVALSQLSRSLEQRQDKRPMLSDLRDSGGVEQDGDVVMFLYRDDYYNAETEKKNIVEVIIGKQRNGPTGFVELCYLKEYNKFVPLTHRR